MDVVQDAIVAADEYSIRRASRNIQRINVPILLIE